MSEASHPPIDVIVVGAGISGLIAADRLQADGLDVMVLDKARGVGGRMATRRAPTEDGTAIFDHGAQFFTVRTQRFQPFVDRWRASGHVVTWCHGFATADAPAPPSGHPRFRGAPGMTAPAKQLAEGLDVELLSPVRAVEREGDLWRVDIMDGPDFRARAVLLTPPVPQSLTLLAAGNVQLPEDARALLGNVSYDPCFALLVRLDGPSAVPPPGGLVLEGDPLVSIADNQQKGISPLPALTLHATPDWTRRHFDFPEEEVASAMLEAAGPWLGSAVAGWQLHRWRYSLSLQQVEGECLIVAGPPPLAFAGDGFGGALIEGAASSGLAAAAGLSALLGPAPGA